MQTVLPQVPLWMNILLGIIALHLLIMPLVSRWAESHLELFLLAIGAAAVTVSGGWNGALVHKTLATPVYVSFIVVVVSVIFNNYSRYIFRILFAFFRTLEPRYSFALLVLILGLISSLVSVTVAALILAEVLQVVNLEHNTTVKITVFACYAIGLGAVLTPLAEPMGLVINNALSGPPHHADFFFLLRHFFGWISPAICGLAVAAVIAPAMPEQLCKCISEKTKKTTPLFCAARYTFICLWRHSPSLVRDCVRSPKAPSPI
ncbi:MAG: DUF1646 family protein [Elusimicrobiaceae bacterium]|nr:DUF1646 family protein [Elusimicrobiaceae bacterium]